VKHPILHVIDLENPLGVFWAIQFERPDLAIHHFRVGDDKARRRTKRLRAILQKELECCFGHAAVIP
jgi:hypothetical protein